MPRLQTIDPVAKQPEKIKKLHNDLSVELVRNPDIIAEVANLLKNLL